MVVWSVPLDTTCPPLNVNKNQPGETLFQPFIGLCHWTFITLLAFAVFIEEYF